MAQAWESDAIQAAGNDWVEAKKRRDAATDEESRKQAEADMADASRRANEARAAEGYSLDGGKANADVKVNDQKTWRKSGAESGYLQGVHGIGTTSKSLDQETYNKYYGPGGIYVDNLDQKVADKAPTNTGTTATQKPVTQTAPQQKPATQTTTQATTQQKASIPAGAVAKTIYPAVGGTAQGYIKNGVTYYLDGTPLKNGDSVIDDNGVKWVKGDAKQNAQAKAVVDALRGVTSQESVAPTVQQTPGLPTTYEEMDAFLQQSYQKGIADAEEEYRLQEESSKAEIEYTTQAAIREQERIAEQARIDSREREKDAYIGMLKAGDNLAYQAAARGNAGGIGLKQYSDEMNRYDQEIYNINAELANVEVEVAQTIADLEARGAFEEAQAAREIGMARINDLRTRRDNLTSQRIGLAQDGMAYRDSQREIAENRAIQHLQLGVFTAEDAVALGIPEADAARIAQQLNVQAQIDLETAMASLNDLTGKTKSNDTPKKVEGDAGDDGDKNPISPVSPIDPNGGTPDNTSAAKSAALRDSLLNELRNAGTLNEEDLLNRIQRAQAAGMSDDDAYALIATLLGNKVADSIYSNYWPQTK